MIKKLRFVSSGHFTANEPWSHPTIAISTWEMIYMIEGEAHLYEGDTRFSVGAGDAFCAGCLYGIYKGFDDKKILEFASGAACCNLSAVDSVSGMRDKDYIFNFIATHERVKL